MLLIMNGPAIKSELSSTLCHRSVCVCGHRKNQGARSRPQNREARRGVMEFFNGRPSEGEGKQYRRKSGSQVGSPFPQQKSAEQYAAEEKARAEQQQKERSEYGAEAKASKEKGRDAGASSAAAPTGKKAFDTDGPVEAVALQSDWQFWNVFSDVRTLGKGHFAKVKQVQHNESAEYFAAKILDKSLADNDIEDLVREFQMLRALRHSNIIRLFAYDTEEALPRDGAGDGRRVDEALSGRTLACTPRTR